MSEIIGYTLSGKNSNGGIFFNGNEPEGVLCPSCGNCFNYDYVPAKMKIHRSKKYDVSYTDDLRTLFSERFVVFCKDILGAKDLFHPIQAGDTIFYYMMPSETLLFDAERRKTKFENPCNLCTGHHSVARAHPAMLKNNTLVKDGFFRTDLAFASGKSKHPLIITSSQWSNKLDAKSFRGLFMEPIHSDK